MTHGLVRRTRRIMTAIATGGVLMQLQSCSPGVSDALITGLEQTSLTFAQVLISALFNGLGSAAAGTASLGGGFF